MESTTFRVMHRVYATNMTPTLVVTSVPDRLKEKTSK